MSMAAAGRAKHASRDPLGPATRVFLIGVLALLASVVTAGPALSALSDELPATVGQWRWQAAAQFLPGVLLLPVVSRTGVGTRRRRTVLIVLLLVLAGTLLVALATNHPLVVAGSALTSLALAVIPACVASAHEAAGHTAAGAVTAVAVAAPLLAAPLKYYVGWVLAVPPGVELGPGLLPWTAVAFTVVALLVAWFTLTSPGWPVTPVRPDRFGILLLGGIGVLALATLLRFDSPWKAAVLVVVPVLLRAGRGSLPAVRRPWAPLPLALGLHGVPVLLVPLLVTSSAGDEYPRIMLCLAVATAGGGVLGILPATPRRLLPAGLVVMALACVWLAATHDGAWWTLIGGTTLLGLGAGLGIAAVTQTALRLLPVAGAAGAVAVLQVVWVIGALFGATVLLQAYEALGNALSPTLYATAGVLVLLTPFCRDHANVPRGRFA